jgi:hypothetical protein
LTIIAAADVGGQVIVVDPDNAGLVRRQRLPQHRLP